MVNKGLDRGTEHKKDSPTAVHTFDCSLITAIQFIPRHSSTNFVFGRVIIPYTYLTFKTSANITTILILPGNPQSSLIKFSSQSGTAAESR